jgi:hypothetical protein
VLDYFEEANVGDEWDVSNPRSLDTKAVSTKQEAKAVVQAFRSCPAARSAWISLDRNRVANRLDQLIDDPRLYSQGRLNLCGPASFFSVWTRRDPVAFARYATTLFETGASSINGRFPVHPSAALLNQDYGAMRARMGTNVTEQADWMVMGALRNNDDAIFVWDGDPAQELAGMTYAEEIEKWLTATGLYSSIDNQIGNALSALSSKGYNAAEELMLDEGVDIFCLVQANMVPGIHAAVSKGFLSSFPNHWVLLIGPVVQLVTTKRVTLAIWSFGRDWEGLEVSDVQTFANNYYGAIVGQMR